MEHNLACYQAGHVWNQSLQPMEVLPCSTQWGWTESDNILGKAAPLLLKAQKHVANSSGVAAKGLPWLCKCSEVTLQCSSHSFYSVNCQHEYLTNLTTYIYMTVYYVVVSCNTYPCISQQNQYKMYKFQWQWKFTFSHLNTTSYYYKWLQTLTQTKMRFHKYTTQNICQSRKQ